MKRNRLGRTDLMVSRICLGTMTWGQQNDEAEGHAQMDRAFDRGVNFIDTAEMYPIPPKPETQGRTEEIVGSWMKARGNRDRVVLATKVIGRSDNAWFRGGRPSRLTRTDIFDAVDKSLARLQTDHIDLYQLHFPERKGPWGFNPNRVGAWPAPRDEDETPIAETLAALDELVKAGKVRHVGLSNESSWGVMRFLAESEAGVGSRIATLQNAYNLLNRTFECGLAEIALREDVGLLAYSPLAQGYLTGKYRDGARPAGARKTLFNRLQRYETPGAEAAISAYVDLAGEIGLSPAHLALKFAATRPFVTSVIIGATNLEQLEHDLAAFDAPWSTETEERVDAIHLLRTNPCP